jgi:hypothetical protein
MKVLALLIIALCAYAAYRHFTAVPPAKIVVADDPSASIGRNCAGVRKATEAMSKKPGVRAGSSLTLLLMGSGPGDEQPRRVFEAALPLPSGVYEPGEDDKARQRIFEQLERACDAAPESAASPVYELVKRAVAQARPERGSKARGYVLVKSDGMDNVQPDLRRALNRAVTKPSVELPKSLAESIDNAGVEEVLFCGGSEVRPRKEARSTFVSPETIARIWRGMFTQKDRVKFEDYCGAAPKQVNPQ